MIRVLFSTIGSREKAQEVARVLVEERTVACVNIVPAVTSVYEWEGKIESEDEALMIIKTAEDRLDDTIGRLKELHPYDVPEIVVLDVERGWPAYLAWVVDQTRSAE